MSDIRTLPQQLNGKLIYQLTSAAAIKETDLFAISTSDKLTRNITLSQIKQYVNSDMYSMDDIDDLLDDIRNEINNVNLQLLEFKNDINEFKNEINKKINKLEIDLRAEIKDVNDALSNRITDLDAKLEGWILYGNSVPTSLPTGRVYLQYFV